MENDITINDTTNKTDDNKDELINKGENPKRKKTHKDLFEIPKRKPSIVEEKKMLGKAVEIMVKTGMKNHVYRFQNQIRIQSRGGPIGLSLTGEVADCYMIDWDKKYLNKLKEVGVELLVYTRFKDDIFTAAEVVEKGTVYINGTTEIDTTKEIDDRDKSDSKVTMEFLNSL